MVGIAQPSEFEKGFNGACAGNDAEMVGIAQPSEFEKGFNGACAQCDLGVYRVTHDHAAVKAEVSLSSPLVAHLVAGQSVLVLEVVEATAVNRIRGLIAEPTGWMTLMETRENYSYAHLVRPISKERAKLVSGILARNQHLARQRQTISELRAELEVKQSEFQDRMQHLETRLLLSKLVPVDPDAEPKDPSGQRYLRNHPRLVRALNLYTDQVQAATAAASIPQVTGIPPGSRLVDVHRLRLDQQMQDALVVKPTRPPDHPAKKDVEPQIVGNFVGSNAWLKPSVNHAIPWPHGVFPVTAPTRLDIDGKLLDNQFTPISVQDVYNSRCAGAWRFSSVGGCPLEARDVDLVKDVYGTGHVHPSTRWTPIPCVD